MAQQTYYGESLSEVSTTGTAWADAAIVTYTPDDNSTYFYFQSAAHALTSSSADCLHRLLNTTSSLVFGLVNAEAKDLTDYVPVFAAGVESFTTGHGAQTVKSQISGESAGIVARIREDRIVVLKKGANDDHEVSAGNSTTTSSSYQDKISRNFTPGSAGDYLVIAFCNRRSSTTGINTFCCLDIDGSIYGEAGHSVADLNTYRPWGTMVKVNLTAAAHTIKLKFRSNGTAIATVNNAVIIILRLSDFVNNYYAEDRARETHNTSTFLTQASLTVSSPANQEHVVLACAQYDHGATTSSTSVRLQEVASGTTNLTEIIEEPVNAATNNVLNWFVAYRKTLAAESHTWNIQHHNESSTIVSGLKDKAIAVLQTGQSGTPVSNQADLRWDITGRASLNIDTRWNLIGRIAAEKLLQWHLHNTVVQQANFRWNAFVAVVRQTELQWNMIGRIYALTESRWNVAVTVQQQDDLRWHINQSVSAVGDELELAWSLAGRVAGESDLRWNLRSAAARALDARWYLTGWVAAASDIRWALRQAAGADLTLQWNTAGAVSSVSSLPWHIRNAVARQVDSRWQLRAATGRELEAAWQLHQLADSENDLRWGLLNEVAGETVLLWDDRQAAAAETEIYWQLIGRIAHWLEIYWNMDGTVPETARSRTLFVKEDSRVASVPADMCILTVPPDNRTATVSPTRTIN